MSNNNDSIKRKSLFLMMFFLLINLLAAQIANERIERITVNEGLSQNYIYDIFQDSRGFLWIGTKDGLNRFDGYNFKIYRHNPHDSTSLSNNSVNVIKEDVDGNIWVGTLGGGLNRYNKLSDNFSRFLHKKNDSNSISDNFITAIYCSDKYGIWTGTNKGHIDCFDYKTPAITHYNFEQFSLESFGENEITNLYMDNNGTLWISSKLGGFDSFNFQNGQINHLIESEQLPEKFRMNHINAFLEDSTKIFWIGTYSGLVKFNPLTNEKEIFQFNNPHNKSKNINSLVKSEQRDILLQSQNSILQFNTITNTSNFVLENSPSTFTKAFLIDHSGIIWVGTQGKGLLKIDLRDLQFHTKPGNYLTMLYGDLIAKLKKEGINVVENNKRGMNFSSIIQDKKKNYWVATDYWGLHKISEDLTTEIKFKTGPIGLRNRMRFIDKVFEDRNGSIWVTTTGGIDKFNESDKSFTHYQIYSDSVTATFAVNNSGYQDITAIYQDKSNIFWLGTPTMGLVKLVPSTREVKYYQYDSANKFSLNNNFILTIAEDPVNPDSILWIGTEGGGLNRFDKANEKFTHFTVEKGLPNNVVYGILADKNGFLWMSTNKGISKFDPVHYTFRNFDISDGLQSNEFNRNEYFKADDGELFFGGISGFNHFYPEQISLNQTAPQLVFTDFQLSQSSVSFRDNNSPLKKPIDETNRIILHYYDNIITFEFAALEFTIPDKNMYAYKLEGLHEDWIYIGNSRMATFTNLDPGDYVFRVKGSNADGIWNEEGISIQLIILPPFWQTWWFTLLALLFLLGSTGYLIKRKIESVKLESLRQHEFSRKLIEFQETERKRIAMELHDSIGQNLLIIKNKLVLGIRHSKTEENDIIPFKEATKIAGETLEEVRGISYHLRPQHLDHLGLTSAIEELIERVVDSCDIEIDSSVDNINNTFSKENEINFYRIVQEGLNNIIKHSGASKVFFIIKKENNIIELIIKDNGKGIKSEEIFNGNGLGVSSMFERAKMLKGKLNISNIGNNGTLLSLKINS